MRTDNLTRSSANGSPSSLQLFLLSATNEPMDVGLTLRTHSSEQGLLIRVTSHDCTRLRSTVVKPPCVTSPCKHSSCSRPYFIASISGVIIHVAHTRVAACPCNSQL